MAHDSSKVKGCLQVFHAKAASKKLDLTEEELRRDFTDTGMLRLLGYLEVGKDIRFEKTIKQSGKRPDIQCSDELGNVVFSIEFKKPADTTQLTEHLPQLWDSYVIPLRSKYGALSNGERLLLYERIGMNSHCILDINLSEVSDGDAQVIVERLRKPSHDMTSIQEVASYISGMSSPSEKRTLATDLARELFFEDFKLEESSPFADLIKSTLELFDFEYGKSRFLTSAYDFWLRSYAKKPYRVPDPWKRLLKSFGLSPTDANLNKFMFCLETSYALFTRLVLAKACEDNKFPHVDFEGFMGRMKEHSFRGDIPLISWGILMTQWIENMRENLVESVFEEDIFYWWTDRFSSMKAWPTKDLFSNRVDPELLPFCKSTVRLLLALYKYDFSEVAGDPLGDLYQNYFDRETRKALGEFYTPKEIVHHILNELEYEGPFVLNKRLLDPSCGSGTFLVEALRRYLKAAESEADKVGWSQTLRKLCNEFHIVGFDIHPFATIMSQIHFMLILIPYYKKAIEEEKDFVLRRIPIFRTDSLLDERVVSKPSITTFVENPDSLQLRITLPVKKEIGDQQFLEIDVSMPKSGAVFTHTGLRNIPEYFCALQALFDTVKSQARSEKYEPNTELMVRNLKEYFSNKDWDRIASYFEPYARQILGTIKILRYQFGDGRLVKSVEDVILAGLLKNYVELENGYDYVVGNPPWGGVLKGKRGALQDDRMREMYSKQYLSAKGKYDIYVLFVERSVKWLRDGGKMGFILQNRFLKVDYGLALRRILLDKTAIKSIVDFGDSRVFKDATNYPCILVFEKNEVPGEVGYYEVLPAAEEVSLDDLLKEIEQSKSERSLDVPHLRKRTVRQKNLNPTCWVSGDDEFSAVQAATAKSARLGDLTEAIMQGVTVGGEGGEQVFCVGKEVLDRFRIEAEVVKKVLKGRDVSRWTAHWDGRYLLYPYDANGRIVDIDDYPSLKHYLEQSKTMLSSRHLDGKNISEWGKEWYSLWRERSAKALSKMKIVSPRISRTNCFALESSDEHFLLDSAVAIVPRNEVPASYLLGVLNSELMFYWMTKTSPFVQGRYFNYSRTYIEKLPVKMPSGKKEERIGRSIQDAVSRMMEQTAIARRTETYPLDYILERGSIELFEVNHLVRKDVRNATSRVRTRSEGGYDVNFGDESSLTVESKEHAEFVRRFLDGKNFRKGERVSLLVPRNSKDVQSIMSELSEDESKLSQHPLSQLEKEIDDLVYDLYGLDKSLRKSIKMHLSRHS